MWLAFGATWLAVVLAGCTAGLGESSDEVELADETRVLENLEEFESAEIDGDRIVFRFSGSADAIDLNEGHIVVGKAQGGYLRRVKSIERSANQLIVETEQASLTDALAQGRVEGQAVARGSGDWNQVVCPEGTTCGAAPVLDLSGLVVFDGEVGGIPLAVRIERGTLDVDPSFDLDLDIGLGGINRFSALATSELALELEVSAEAGGALELAEEIDLSGPDTPLYSHPFTFAIPTPLGPFPVVGAIELDVSVGFSAKFSAQASAIASVEGGTTVELGAEYDGQDWSQRGELAEFVSTHSLTLDGQGSTELEAFIRPEIRAVFYGVGGPGISLTPSLRGQAQVIPPVLLASQLEGCLRGDIDFVLDVLSFQLDDFSAQAERCEVLLQEGFGTEPLIISAGDGQVIIDTDNGTITRVADGADLTPGGLPFVAVDQGVGTPLVGLFSASEIVIEAGAEVSVVGSAALGLHSAGDLTIDGIIDATGGRGENPANPGPGGFGGGELSDSPAPGLSAGGGPGGGTPGSSGSDVGGGGGGHGAPGGAGGNRGQNRGGGGGVPYGDDIALIGGSGGSLGGGSDFDGGGNGGGGGGAVRITAGGIVSIGAQGGINCGGGGGQGGALDDGGGGGGAGGMIAIQASQLVMAGILAANGGGGGAGANDEDRGTSGQAGLLGAQVARGGAGAGEGSAGGDGGSSNDPMGKAGVSVQGNEGQDDNAGGGGGAAGRILLSVPATSVTGIVSPNPIVR